MGVSFENSSDLEWVQCTQLIPSKLVKLTPIFIGIFAVKVLVLHPGCYTF